MFLVIRYNCNCFTTTGGMWAQVYLRKNKKTMVDILIKYLAFRSLAMITGTHGTWYTFLGMLESGLRSVAC